MLGSNVCTIRPTAGKDVMAIASFVASEISIVVKQPFVAATVEIIMMTVATASILTII